MTLTADMLELDDTPTTAYVLLIDGVNLAFTDTHQVSSMASRWAAETDWSNFMGGLIADGEIRQTAQPFDSKVETPKISLSLLDDEDNTIAKLMLREANDDAITEELADNATSSMNSSQTYMLLGDSASLPASGSVHIETEEITYALNNGGGLLAGLTRGVRSLFGTSGGSRFGQPHRLELDPTNPGGPALFRPEASTAPREWIGRSVALYLCVRIDGVWTAGDQAECLWAGTIRDIIDDPENHRIHLECSHILERLRGSILRRQYRGRLEEGMWITTTSGNLSVKVRKGYSLDGSWDDPVSATTTTLVPSDDLYTHAEVATLINDQLDDWFDGSPFTTDWDLGLDFDATAGRYKWTFTYSGAAPGGGHSWMWLIEIQMSRYLAYLLGYEISWQDKTIKEGPTPVDDTPTYSFYWYAPGQPLRVAMPAPGDSGQLLRVTPESGEFHEQARIPAGMPADTTAFLRIGGKTVVCVTPTGNADEFEVTGYIPEDGALGLTAVRLTAPGYSPDPPFSLERIVADAFTDEGVLVEQVWLEFGAPHEIFLRLLASTGTAGYNHSSYDDLPEQMSLGLPWQMIDSASFALLGSGVVGDAYVLYVDKPQTFVQRFESALQFKNLHVFWHRGKIRLTSFGESGGATLRLSEDTKRQELRGGELFAPVRQISQVRRTTDYLVNRVALKYNIPLGGSDDRQASTFIVNNTGSQFRTKDYAPVAVDAIGRYEELGVFGTSAFLDQWIEEMAAVAVAYFGSHLCVFTVSYGLSHLFEIYPGRQALVTDARIFHPRIGERGVTDLPCWCFAAGFTLKSSLGAAVMMFNPRNVP